MTMPFMPFLLVSSNHIHICLREHPSHFFSIVLVLKRKKFFYSFYFRYGYKPSVSGVGWLEGEKNSRAILHHFPTIVVRSLAVLFYGRSFQLFHIISRSFFPPPFFTFWFTDFCCQHFHMVGKAENYEVTLGYFQVVLKWIFFIL